MTDPSDDRCDEPDPAWGVEGPAFGRRPAAVEPLRDELARYLAAAGTPDAVAGAAGELQASRGPSG